MALNSYYVLLSVFKEKRFNITWILLFIFYNINIM